MFNRKVEMNMEIKRIQAQQNGMKELLQTEGNIDE